MGLKLYHEAINYFNQSIEYCNEHYISFYYILYIIYLLFFNFLQVTYHNMGVSYYYLQDYTNARECFKKSLKLKASYRDAQVWLERVEQSIQEIQHTGTTPGGPSTPVASSSTNNNNNSDEKKETQQQTPNVDERQEQQLQQGDVIRQDSNNDVVAVVPVSEK